jgi:uncharacterized protein (DUF2147 family)
MHKIKLFIYLFIFVTPLSAQHPDDIIGKYHLPNKLDIEIFKEGEKYNGRIIALNQFEYGQTKDINNPDKFRQADLLVGKVIIKSLEFDIEKKQWVNGEMYGPEKGMVFYLKVKEVKQKEIIVVGSKFIIRRTLSWEKIS